MPTSYFIAAAFWVVEVLSPRKASSSRFTISKCVQVIQCGAVAGRGLAGLTESPAVVGGDTVTGSEQERKLLLPRRSAPSIRHQFNVVLPPRVPRHPPLSRFF